MSHWYDFPPIKKRLTKIQDEMDYIYKHHGESLLVIDARGAVVRLTSLEKAMDFARTVESVLNVVANRELERLC